MTLPRIFKTTCRCLCFYMVDRPDRSAAFHLPAGSILMEVPVKDVPKVVMEKFIFALTPTFDTIFMSSEYLKEIIG